MPATLRTPSLLVMALIAGVAGGVAARLVPLESSTPSAPMTGRPLTDATDLPALVKRSASAVVNIAVLQPSPAEQNPLLRDPFFRQYLGVPDSALRPAISAGSGVIVDAERGLVVTNFHVVQNARAVEIGLTDGRHLAAEPVAFAPQPRPRHPSHPCAEPLRAASWRQL